MHRAEAERAGRLVNMNPYFTANISLTCLLVLKVLASALNGTKVTEIDLAVLLIAAGMFHMGITSITEYFTGKKIITA